MEAILAKDIKNGLSKDGVIPWASKKDLSFFYEKTKNNIVIMGKKTYFSLPDKVRPLKNRLNIVLSSRVTDVEEIFYNLLFTKRQDIYEYIMENREKILLKCPFLNPCFKIFIIGGKQIYEKFIPLCETVWITQIKTDYSCDLIMDNTCLNLFKRETNYYEDEDICIKKYCKMEEN